MHPQNEYFSNLHLYTYGHEVCEPGHFFGPAVRNNYLIHYIIKGKGQFMANGCIHHLTKGQAFLIEPLQVSYYVADMEDPWEYTWVDFNGEYAKFFLLASGLSRENPIFTFRQLSVVEHLYRQICNRDYFGLKNIVFRLGILYQLLSEFMSQSTSAYASPEKNADLYTIRVKNYIDAHLELTLTVSTISSYIGLDRSYLGSLFKKKYGISIQNYLIKARMQKAVQLLKTTNLSVSDIGRSVGYNNPLIFSKAFKKYSGISPKGYREDWLQKNKE